MLYNLVKFICTLIIKIIFRINVEGKENFPKEGPVILYSNHKSMWDPIIIGCVIDRPIFFMAKSELFRYPVFGLILKNINAFPVKRGAPDRKAIRRALEILSENKVLGIFPEGTRSKADGLLKPEPGIALIAVKSKNSILVPVAIKGSYKIGSNIDVKIGNGINFSEKYEKHEKLNSLKLSEISQEIFNEISKLMT